MRLVPHAESPDPLGKQPLLATQARHPMAPTGDARGHQCPLALAIQPGHMATFCANGETTRFVEEA